MACGPHQVPGRGLCAGTVSGPLAGVFVQALSLGPSAPFPCFWIHSSFEGQNCGLFPTCHPSGRSVGTWRLQWGILEAWPLPQQDNPDH